MATAHRYSLLVCTFNPSTAVLRRCLASIAALSAPEGGMEVTVVDNASRPALGELDVVRQFFSENPGWRLITESRAGLTNARLAGLRASTGDVFILIDDDNRPESDYLTKVQALVDGHQGVGVWGPGVIDVEWEEGTPGWIRGYATCFQERRATAARFGAIAGWPDFYPTGTGMVVRREVLEEYARQIAAGRISASDRKGTQLTSAGDAQIIWTAVRMGLAAGTSPELRLTHFVEKRKATLRYILRMVFAAMASGRIAMRQSFPERPELWNPPSSLRAQAELAWLALKELCLLRVRSGPVQVVRRMGDLHGQFVAARQAPPWMTRLAARWLGFSWDDA